MTEKNKIHVLCIEDSEAVIRFISNILDQSKYTLNSISDGKKALDFLLTSDSLPDIILLDYNLPSLNGIEILKALKSNKKKYAVVFLTAEENLEIAVSAIKEGAIDYLAKSSNLKAELNIKIELAYQQHQERLKIEYYEEQLTLLSLAVEQSPNSFVITDKSGNIEYVNKQFTNYTGYALEEVKGKNPRILKGGSYPPKFFQNLWNTISSGRIWKGELINKKKNGDLFYEKALISPIINKTGDIVSYLGIKEDITELKKAEDALKKKTEEINQFFTVVLDLLCIIDSAHKFTRLNKAWENTLGYSIDELIDKSYLDFVHPDDLELTIKAASELSKTGRLSNFVNRYRCKDGTYKFIEWNCVTNVDDTFYASARDITKRKLYEEELKERDLTKDKFFSIIAHDLKSQFFVIIGFAELLMKKGKFTDQNKKKFVKTLHESSQNGLALLEDLLEWSRSQLNKVEFMPEKLNVQNMIDDVLLVVKNQAALKLIELVSEVNGNHEIFVDRRMMNTVLRNLLGNAIKFTPAGGRIVVSATINNNNNIISVKDNGIGIPHDVVDKLFRIDFKHSTMGTEKEKGTGLGLFLVKEFVEKHGGKVTVESELSRGSEFIISIPEN